MGPRIKPWVTPQLFLTHFEDSVLKFILLSVISCICYLIMILLMSSIYHRFHRTDVCLIVFCDLHNQMFCRSQKIPSTI